MRYGMEKLLHRLWMTALAVSALGMVGQAWGQNITFSAQTVNVVPSTELETTTPFSLTISVTNNTASAIEYTGWDVWMTVDPAVPDDTIMADGDAPPSGAIEFKTPGGVGTGNPASDEFLNEFIIVSWSRASGSASLAGFATQQLVTLHLELMPGAPLEKWNLLFDPEVTGLTNGSGSAVPPGTIAFSNGSIATPEPSALALLVVGAMGLLRRRARA